jgi:hypothetical protein
MNNKMTFRTKPSFESNIAVVVFVLVSAVSLFFDLFVWASILGAFVLIVGMNIYLRTTTYVLSEVTLNTNSFWGLSKQKLNFKEVREVTTKESNLFKRIFMGASKTIVLVKVSKYDEMEFYPINPEGFKHALKSKLIEA